MSRLIAEKIADMMAWILQTDLPKHMAPILPQHDAEFFEVLMTSSVILCFTFFYLFLGAVYQLTRYGSRVYFRTKLLTLSFGLLCLSASFILVFRLYNFWYQDMTGSIYAYYTFTSLIVLIAFIMTALEYKSLRGPTKKEYQTLADKVEEVAAKHGIK